MLYYTYQEKKELKKINDFYIEAKKCYEKYSLEDLYEIFENFNCDFYGWPEVMDALRDTIKEKES